MRLTDEGVLHDLQNVCCIISYMNNSILHVNYFKLRILYHQHYHFLELRSLRFTRRDAHFAAYILQCVRSEFEKIVRREDQILQRDRSGMAKFYAARKYSFKRGFYLRW